MAMLAVTLSAIAGCGGGADDEARELNKRSVIAEAPPLEEFLVSEQEIKKASDETPERSLLNYWASLQYQSWDTATAYYATDLREFLGDDRLQYALANQAAYFRSSRPKDIEVRSSNGKSVTKFLVEDQKGNETPSSVTWARRGGAWRIVHDPYLNNALAQARQLDIQVAVDPTSQKPSKEALRAAYAARKLQAAFAASKQERSKRSGTPAIAPPPLSESE